MDKIELSSLTNGSTVAVGLEDGCFYGTFDNKGPIGPMKALSTTANKFGKMDFMAPDGTVYKWNGREKSGYYPSKTLTHKWIVK